MSNNAAGLTRKVTLAGFDMYVTVNLSPQELFVKVAKEGSFTSGLLSALAITASVAMQRGVPWAVIREAWRGMRFEPNDDRSTSLVDLLANTVDELRAGQDASVGTSSGISRGYSEVVPTPPGTEADGGSQPLLRAAAIVHTAIVDGA